MTGVSVLLDARFRPDLRGGDRYRFELLRALGDVADLDILPIVYREASSMTDGPAKRTRIHSHQHPWAELYEHLVIPALIQQTGRRVYHGTFQSLPRWTPRGCRTVLTVHDTALFDLPELFSPRFRAIAIPQLKASICGADHVVCVTETTRARLHELFPHVAGRTTAILNGVSPTFHPRDRIETERHLEPLGLSAPYVLFVGNLEPKKNLRRLVDAFGQLNDLPHHLVIVGARPDGTRPDELPSASTRVRRLGYVEEAVLPWLYAGADLVAYPSTYEGFGMPVLEGMASGVPVLTSSASCLPEVAGGAAMLVDPFSTEAIADGLRKALTDTAWRCEAVRDGLVRASGLTWESNAHHTAAIYRALGGGLGDR